MDGFYAGYFTSTGGMGFAMFILRDGSLIGADPTGVTFDGSYVTDADGSAAGTVSVSAPPGVTLIQGVTSGPEGLNYVVPVRLPADFQEAPFIRLVTPFGPVNVRLVKLRDV